MNPVLCGHCGRAAQLVTGAEAYRCKPHMADKLFWFCQPCDAWVGCHERGTWHTTADGQKVVHEGTEPKGRLANARLRAWHIRAHAAFDPIWKTRAMRRSAAYDWLAKAMGLTKDTCHIGLFDVEECRRVEQVCYAWRAANTGPGA
jgi:hypothetical protein